MAQTIEATVSKPSAGLRIPIRGMHWHLHANSGPFQEEAIPNNQRGLLRDWDCLPFVSSGTRRKDEPRGNEASGFDRYHTAIRPMTLSRVVTSSFLRMLFWKGVVEMAQRELAHYERVWDGLEEFEDAVKAETKLLTK